MACVLGCGAQCLGWSVLGGGGDKSRESAEGDDTSVLERAYVVEALGGTASVDFRILGCYLMAKVFGMPECMWAFALGAVRERNRYLAHSVTRGLLAVKAPALRNLGQAPPCVHSGP